MGSWAVPQEGSRVRSGREEKLPQCWSLGYCSLEMVPLKGILEERNVCQVAASEPALPSVDLAACTPKGRCGLLMGTSSLPWPWWSQGPPSLWASLSPVGNPLGPHSPFPFLAV